MALPSFPTNLIPGPFAQDGNYTVIPETATTPGRASFSEGFPTITQQPLREGGIAPNRLDFNGILNMLSAFGFWQQSGGQAVYASGLDYQPPNVVYHNGKMWWCVQQNGPETPNGPQEPGTDETYWLDLLLALSQMAGGLGGGFNATMVLTSESPSFTVPNDGTFKITCIGGGGAGGAGGQYYGGAGGLSGGITRCQGISANGGSGGGGGGGGVRVAGGGQATFGGGAGGGGAPGRVTFGYRTLPKGRIVSATIGAGARRNTAFTLGGYGANGSGDGSGGMGAIGNFMGGGGAVGASNGGNGMLDIPGINYATAPEANRAPNGGAGGRNYKSLSGSAGFGGGGGGGGGSARFGSSGTTPLGNGGAAWDGAERGGASQDGGLAGYGGAGGDGAVILEYFIRAE